MIFHLFYKEWLKTRWFAIFSMILGISVVLYGFIELNSMIAYAGSKANYIHTWFTMGGNPHWILMKDIPMVVALLIGVSQYYPEVVEKRIKLTLHLPYHNNTLLYLMVLSGFALIMAVYIAMYALFFSINAAIFPKEISAMAISEITPSFVWGLITYFFIAMIAMEPIWKFRFLYMLFVAGVIYIFKINSFNASYSTLLIILVVSSLSILFTSNRFKIGEL